MDFSQLIPTLAIWALPVLFAITVHEAAHGWAAKQLGDPTAQMLGRLSFNPLKHIDPLGTIIVPAVLLMLGGFLFGWAKPVPVTWENLKNPKRDMALVAAAGPGANFLMALFWALMMKVAIFFSGVLPWASQPLYYMGQAGIQINVILMVLNLLPIPPLDGGRVATGLLPGRASYYLSQVEPYGLLILLGLLATGYLSILISPAINSVLGLISHIL